MKHLMILALGILSATANAAGGSVVSGGRGATIVCSQPDSSIPSYEIIIQPNLFAHLTVTTTGRSYRYRLDCQQESTDEGRTISCAYTNLYTIQINNESEAAVFNGRGFVKNLSCELN